MGRTFLVKQGSLTDGDELLLVNAANTNVALGSGVSGAIRAACGAGYQARILEALDARYGGPMAPGQVLVTDAGTHPTARYVAHVAVMDYRKGFTGDSHPDLARIETCCVGLWEAIERIDHREPISIAMVALGAGTGRLGVRDPTEVACRTLKAHLEKRAGTRIGNVTFYGFVLYEHLAMLEVVSSFFHVPEESLSAEIREHLNHGGSGK